MWAFSLFKAICIGGLGYMIGIIMDETISKRSLQMIRKDEPKLYEQGMRKVRENMLIITPTVYFISDMFLFNHTNFSFRIDKALFLLLFHNFSYYLAHKAMHNVSSFRKYHEFQTRFFGQFSQRIWTMSRQSARLDRPRFPS